MFRFGASESEKNQIIIYEDGWSESALCTLKTLFLPFSASAKEAALARVRRKAEGGHRICGWHFDGRNESRTAQVNVKIEPIKQWDIANRESRDSQKNSYTWFITRFFYWLILNRFNLCTNTYRKVFRRKY